MKLKKNTWLCLGHGFGYGFGKAKKKARERGKKFSLFHSHSHFPLSFQIPNHIYDPKPRSKDV